MRLIRSELGFLGELDDAFLVFLPGIPFAHGPSIPSLLPRGVSVFVIRAIARRAFTPLRGNQMRGRQGLQGASELMAQAMAE